MTLALGYPHPRHLQQHLTSQDITEWMAYESLEPFGEARMDLRIGTLISMFYNANRDSKQDPAGKVWFDFLPNVNAPQQDRPVGPDPDLDPDAACDFFVTAMLTQFGEDKNT